MTFLRNSINSPTHIYANDGDFTVTLTAYDEVGLMSTDTCMVTAYPACEGDFDNDRDINGSDLAVFAADFGRTDCESGLPCEGDFDGDGDVDGSDLAVFATDFGRIDCPLPTYQTYMIYLEEYDYFTLPIEPLSPYTAQSVLTQISDQHGVEMTISHYKGPEVKSYCTLDPDPEDDFDIEEGEGYFIDIYYYTEPLSIDINGPLVTEVTYDLKQGWNLLGLPANLGSYTAEGFMTEVNNQGGNADRMYCWYNDQYYWHYLGKGDGFLLHRD